MHSEAEPALDLGDLESSIERQLEAGAERVSGGYQGTIALCEIDGRRYVVKSPNAGGWLSRFAQRRMLWKEMRIYHHLTGCRGIPKCYGILGGQHLVLEYIAGDNLRHATPVHWELFFDRLFEVIQTLHERQVAHGDLKKKDNLLVGPGDEPYIVDFGLAVIRRHGFHPLNHALFRMLRAWDLSAWIKRKHGTYDLETIGDDRRYLYFTWSERVGRHLKGPLKRLLAMTRHTKTTQGRTTPRPPSSRK